MKRLILASSVLFLLLALASPGGAARIGIDDRNGQDADRLFGSGADFSELRSVLTGLGHTLVPMTSFESGDIAAANVTALYLRQPFQQGGVEFTANEISAIQGFVAGGGGLALHAEGGAGSEPDALASMNALASAWTVSFASGNTTQNNGHTILAFNSHPVTQGLPSSLISGGFCVDSQRILTIGAGAIDLTSTDGLAGEDNALAAVGTVAGDFGNVVFVSDTSAFANEDPPGGQDVHIDLCDNRLVATNIANFVVPIPEPGTAVLLGFGLAALGARRARRLRRAAPVAVVTCAVALGVGLPQPARAACTAGDARCSAGEFGDPFADPLLLGLNTEEKCLQDEDGEIRCKPTAGTLVALHDDRILYWNALEGSENVELSLIAEFGFVTTNDQSRLLTIDEGHPDGGIWTKPSPEDGGANPDGNEDALVCPDPITGEVPQNRGADGSLFCSDQVMLHDGRVLAAGGTDYYNDTCVDWQFPPLGGQNPLPIPPGGTELEGLKDARIFDPATDTWEQTDSMQEGRWYPTAVTLPDGDVFIASGVRRLTKPVYPEDPMASGRNVVVTETYDTSCGQWSSNGATGEKSLPLFPRLHLLPNGNVYFNAAGQAFNPFGQAYDQTLWNLISTYDPATKSWTDHGIAGLDPNNPLDLTNAGFRGSTFSVMLTLEPDAGGSYTSARFLTAGGVLSEFVNPSPGGYTATTHSRVDTMDLSGLVPLYSSAVTAPLVAPRWYGSGTLLPNGQVLATSGADRDEVWTPGEEIPVMTAELFDPDTGTWTPVATQHNKRTYHNTAVLMRDGRVLVGGHSPVTNSYAAFDTPTAGGPGNSGRDPTFEIYSPWYVFRDDRPAITDVSSDDLANGASFTADVTLGAGASFHSMVLMRRSTHTHVVDGDQRAVRLPATFEDGVATMTVPGSSVLPPGKYVLYANNTTADGVVPSEGVAVTVGSGVVGPCPQ